MKVIQQPERARACGAGAKSSADRRPVDPPPIVELRIFQTEAGSEIQRDITFAYNANFFLFATLDTARPIAQGRTSTQTPTIPVLTGVPVAGIAYLDRPIQAGYFIFPDLSVRHEGRYRLNFNLYEELKEKDDADKDAPVAAVPEKRAAGRAAKPITPNTYLHFRLEVKSAPFTVYSAKKFPGLATSTNLSRVVAEQGCRVRIRRDVRMRRRGEKGNKDFGDYDDDRLYAQSPRYTTPDGFAIERPCSTSNSTPATPYAYAPELHRRPSIEYGFAQPQLYQQSPVPGAGVPTPPSTLQPPVPAGAHSTGGTSRLAFGATQSQYPAPQVLPAPASTPVPNSTPAPSYSGHSGVDHARNSSNCSEHENTPIRPYQQPSIHTLLTTRPDDDHRLVLPPLRYNPRMPKLPPLTEVVRSDWKNGGLPASVDVSSGYKRSLLYDTDSHLSKRSHEETFGHCEQRPLQNGQRPDADVVERRRPGRDSADGFPGLAHVDGPMEYRRADGSVTTKFRQEV